MITLIAAVSDNNVIGYQDKIPWRIPEDLERFKKLTLGNPIVMGRKTFQSLPRKPLPDRKNVVVTRHPGLLREYLNQGVIVATDVHTALRVAEHHGRNIYVIGGQQIYAETIDLAHRLEITKVKGEFQGDAFFPEIDSTRWKEIARNDRQSYSFVTYIKNN